MSSDSDPERSHALHDYKTKLLDSREWEAKLKALRLEIKGLQRDFDISEENIKALQSVGQIIGEVLKQLDEERCEWPTPTLADRLPLPYVTCVLANSRWQSSSRRRPGLDMSWDAGQRWTRLSSSRAHELLLT